MDADSGDRATGEREVFTSYLSQLADLAGLEGTSEGTRYPALAALLTGVARSRSLPVGEVIVLPRPVAGGLCPDLQMLSPSGLTIGYVEAKPPGRDLRRTAEGQQVAAYRASFPNLLLTDFYEFVLFRGSEEVRRARLARCLDRRRDPRTHRELGALWSAPPIEDSDSVAELLSGFLSHPVAGAGSVEELASGLARRTRQLRRVVLWLMGDDSEIGRALSGYRKAFSEHLIAGLTPGAFADLYAEALTFGLFAARDRLGRGEPFGLRAAWDAIPEGHGILRDVFRFISLTEPPAGADWILDDLVSFLGATDVAGLFAGERARGADPITHFYESFLQVYDPDLRKQRGVFYTPPELVGYMVRSVDEVLRDSFGLPAGLADPSVRLLDPAAGTLAFVVEAARQALATAVHRLGSGALDACVREHLLRDFYGFELMIAPYALGHFNFARVLEELGYRLDDGERARFYLTDALDLDELKQSELPGASSLAAESRRAARVKNELPVTVIVGNPPYRGRPDDAGPKSDHGRLRDLLRDGYTRADGSRDDGYFAVGGRGLGEANPKWLWNDYVKFLRFAQWKVDQAGEGVVVLVTDHGYLDSPTFRGLRESLLASFDQLHFLDLHGGGRRKERAPDGGRDENVFPIRQGVAVMILVKRPGLPRRVVHAERHGDRRSKLAWLAGHSLATTEWREVEPRPPQHLLTPAAAPAVRRAYERFAALPEIFPYHRVGVVTGRDVFVLDVDREDLVRRIAAFRRSPEASWSYERAAGLTSTRTWDLDAARRAAAADGGWEERLVTLLYRPFNLRHLFYADYLLERPRPDLARHLFGGTLEEPATPVNLGLIVPRQGRGDAGALITDRLPGHKTVSAYDVNHVFPLYLYPHGLFAGAGSGEARRPNLGPEALSRLSDRLASEPSPEDVLAYVYALLHTPRYRRRYADLLERDFPRLPWPPPATGFRALAALGRELIDLHLLREPPRGGDPAEPCRLLGAGDAELAGSAAACCDYRPEEHSVYLNPRGQRFTGIRPEVWELRIGGYQVLRRWLADRAGRVLRHDDLIVFPRIVAALAGTLAVRERLDALYPEIDAGA